MGLNCSTCKENKAEEEFYKNRARSSGRSSACKPCDKARNRRWQAENAVRYKEYQHDHYLNNKEHYVKKAAVWSKVNPGRHRELQRKYEKSEKGLATHRRAEAAHRRRHPLRVKARSAVGGAIATGKMQRPAECDCCRSGGKIEAHHYDYGKPLDVQWLCRPCHLSIHTI